MRTNKLYHVEACVTNVEQAIAAASRGADRLELCVRLETEGMTPEISLVSDVLAAVSIPVRIMIRETETGYEADDIDFEKMKNRIAEMYELPIDGFVFGILKNNRLDREIMTQLIKACGHHHITFHKALDESTDIADDIAWLNTCPTVDTILTSGSAVRALDGVEQILKMKGMFHGHVMAAGKILAGDLDDLHSRLGLNWYHGRAIV